MLRPALSPRTANRRICPTSNGGPYRHFFSGRPEPLARRRGSWSTRLVVRAALALWLDIFLDARTDLQPPPLSHAEIRSIIIGIMLAMLLAALDQTIVATALPTIGRDLNDVAHLSWIVTAYLLASTAVTPLYGKLSDIYGRRVTLLAGIAGIAIFVVGSAACALAPTMLALILARALQGLGGGGLISLAQTIIVAPR